MDLFAVVSVLFFSVSIVHFSLLYVNIGTRERHECAEDILFAVCEHWDEREA
jgi:hypothetical protein